MAWRRKDVLIRDDHIRVHGGRIHDRIHDRIHGRDVHIHDRIHVLDDRIHDHGHTVEQWRQRQEVRQWEE